MDRRTERTRLIILDERTYVRQAVASELDILKRLSCGEVEAALGILSNLNSYSLKDEMIRIQSVALHWERYEIPRENWEAFFSGAEKLYKAWLKHA